MPGLTDTEESVRKVVRLAKSVCTPEKTELLPFRKLCSEKYERLRIPFPLSDTPECDATTIATLYAAIKDI